MSFTGKETSRKIDSAPVGRSQPRDNRSVGSKGPPPAKMPPRRTWGWFLLLVVVNYLLVRLLIPSATAPVAVPYTLFKDEVGKGNVKAIHSQGDAITGKFSSPVTYPPGSDAGGASGAQSKKVTNFRTTLPSF